MLLSLLFKIDFATARQSFRSTDAQKRDDNDAKHISLVLLKAIQGHLLPFIPA